MQNADQELQDKHAQALKMDILGPWKQVMRQHPPLPRDVNMRWIARYQRTQDQNLLNKIVSHNLGLALWAYAKFIKSYNIGQDDTYYQSAVIGVSRAIETYDPDKGEFSTYAYKWMYQKMQREYQTNNNSIYIPAWLLIEQQQIRRANKQRDLMGLKPLTNEEILELVNRKSDGQEKIIGNATDFHNIPKAIPMWSESADGEEFILPDIDLASSVEDKHRFFDQEQADQFLEILEEMDEKYQVVVKARFGIYPFTYPMSTTEILEAGLVVSTGNVGNRIDKSIRYIQQRMGLPMSTDAELMQTKNMLKESAQKKPSRKPRLKKHKQLQVNHPPETI